MADREQIYAEREEARMNRLFPEDDTGFSGRGQQLEQNSSPQTNAVNREEKRLEGHWLTQGVPKSSVGLPQEPKKTKGAEGWTKKNRVNLVRPSLGPKGSAEMAMHPGESEDQLLDRSLIEAKSKARKKEKREREPVWKQKERERNIQIQDELQRKEREERFLYQQWLESDEKAKDNEQRRKEDLQRQEREAKQKWADDRKKEESQEEERRRRQNDVQRTETVSSSEAARREEARLQARWLSPSVGEHPEQIKASPDAPGNWNVETTVQWLATIGLEVDKVSSVQGVFRQNDVNGKHLLSLTKEDLEEMGIQSFGVRKSILSGVEKLKAN